MADDHTKRGAQDRTSSQIRALGYWTQALNVDDAQLHALLVEVELSAQAGPDKLRSNKV